MASGNTKKLLAELSTEEIEKFRQYMAKDDSQYQKMDTQKFIDVASRCDIFAVAISIMGGIKEAAKEIRAKIK